MAPLRKSDQADRRLWRFLLRAAVKSRARSLPSATAAVAQLAMTAVLVLVFMEVRGYSKRVRDATDTVIDSTTTKERRMKVTWNHTDAKGHAHTIEVPHDWDFGQTTDWNMARWNLKIEAVKAQFPAN